MVHWCVPRTGSGLTSETSLTVSLTDMSSVYWQVIDIILSMKASLFDVSVNFHNFHLGNGKEEVNAHYIIYKYSIVFVLFIF